MLRVRDYLAHILEAIQRINEYVEDMSEVDFLSNHLVQDAVIRNIEIIGEAAKNIEQKYLDFAAQHASIPWGVMYAMRNRVSHGYFKVDFELVWKTVQNDLPILAQQISAVQET